MVKVAIIVPVLNRPQRIRAVIENVTATTPRCRLLFVANEGDDAEIAELEATGADHLIVADARSSFACKINDGYRATTEAWIFTGADDLKFHPEWFERALRWADDSTGVIGTNDICNPRVMGGQHSTHSLFRRSYVEKFGTIDEPGLVMHEGYRHDFTDDEAVATAKVRGVYVHAFDSIVEHLHPLVGKSPDDDTYRLGKRYSMEGRRLFQRRKALWSDPEVVRMAMIPPPERAVVVTATYGNYDAHLHVPVEQDIPVEWICFTDDPELEVPKPWQVRVEPGVFGEDSRMSAKVPKMLPDVGCPDVVWVDASHEIISRSFVRQALAARHDGIAAFKHPRRICAYQEINALLGSENQGGLYFSRPLREQVDAYRAEGYPQRAGLFACGVLAWDLREEKAKLLGRAWLDETEKWSHQDQCEFPVVCRRLGIEPGTFPIAQIDHKRSRGKPYFENRWFRIHPHITKPDPMPQEVSVLIPFQSDDPFRIAAFEFIRKHYQAYGWEVIVGTCEGEWSKGRAAADAFSRSTHDILVVADADCLIDDASMREAVRSVSAGNAWVVPHRRGWRLTQQATKGVIARGKPRPVGNPQPAVIGGGVVVCSREAWIQSGGIDPRFEGWGGEDISFGWALQTLFGPGIYGRGKLFHLWHPPVMPRRGSPGSEQLAGRYRRARGDPEAMRALIDEAKVMA